MIPICLSLDECPRSGDADDHSARADRRLPAKPITRERRLPFGALGVVGLRIEV